MSEMLDDVLEDLKASLPDFISFMRFMCADITPVRGLRVDVAVLVLDAFSSFRADRLMFPGPPRHPNSIGVVLDLDNSVGIFNFPTFSL